MLIAVAPRRAQAGNKLCQAVERGFAEDAVAYLRDERARLDDTCVKAAISKLGELSYLAAVDVLALYLRL